MTVDFSKYHLQSITIREVGDSGDGGVTSIIKSGIRRRLLAQEASNLSNSSTECDGSDDGEYHAEASITVPFTWESSPGTPKRHFNYTKKSSFYEIDSNKLIIPSLNPPPSYLHRQNNNNLVCPQRNYGVPESQSYAIFGIRSSSKKKKQNDSNVTFIQTIFPQLSLKRDNSPSFLSSSSSSSKPSSLESSQPPSSSLSSLSSKLPSMMSTPSPSDRHRLSIDLSGEIEDEEEEVVVGGGGSPISATLCFRCLSCCNGKLRGLYSTWF